MNETARALAQKHRLIRGGEFFCWGCGSECPFDATLHDEGCVIEHHRARTDALRIEARMSDEDHRWRGMLRNMREDSRLNTDLAFTLLTNARKLPSCTPALDGALTAAYRERFGKTKQRDDSDGWADPEQDGRWT